MAKDYGYTIVPNALFRDSEDLTASERLTLLALLSHTRYQVMECYPSQATLVSDTGLSVATVKRALAGLRRKGRVSWEARQDGAGRRTSNVYKLHIPTPAPSNGGGSQEGEGVGHSDPSIAHSDPSIAHSELEDPFTVSYTHSSQRAIRNKRKRITNKRINPSPPKVLSPGARNSSNGLGGGFEKFWNAYPRHDNEPEARIQFQQALERADAVDIIHGAEQYRDDPNRNPRFTKTPANWLRDSTWLDYQTAPNTLGRIRLQEDQRANGQLLPTSDIPGPYFSIWLSAATNAIKAGQDRPRALQAGDEAVARAITRTRSERRSHALTEQQKTGT